MPIYDYTCEKCGRLLELLVLSTTDPLCPHCGSGRLQQMIGAPAAPGRSAKVIAAGRARATKAGHTSNYRRSNGRIVD